MMVINPPENEKCDKCDKCDNEWFVALVAVREKCNATGVLCNSTLLQSHFSPATHPVPGVSVRPGLLHFSPFYSIEFHPPRPTSAGRYPTRQKQRRSAMPRLRVQNPTNQWRPQQ